MNELVLFGIIVGILVGFPIGLLLGQFRGTMLILKIWEETERKNKDL